MISWFGVAFLSFGSQSLDCMSKLYKTMSRRVIKWSSLKGGPCDMTPKTEVSRTKDWLKQETTEAGYAHGQRLQVWQHDKTTRKRQISLFFSLMLCPQQIGRRRRYLGHVTTGSTAALWTIITHNMLRSRNALHHSSESYLLPKVTSTAQWTCSPRRSISCLLENDLPSQPQKRR